MTLANRIKKVTAEALQTLYPDIDINSSSVAVNQTKPEFTGEYTVVLFPFVKLLRQKPDVLGKQLGDHLVSTHPDLFTGYEIAAGFLNLSIGDNAWLDFLTTTIGKEQLAEMPATGKKVMVEYSSPNTNKPLHFGHLRNIFLGYAMAEVLEATGNDVVKANLINDRGIHICKSMLAWQKYANGATPETTNIKGDHLVGDYYVKFNDILNEQVAPDLKLTLSGQKPEYVEGDKAEKIDKYIKTYVTATEELEADLSAIAEQVKDASEQVRTLINGAISGEIKWKEVSGNKEIKEAFPVVKRIVTNEGKKSDSKGEIKEILNSYAPIMLEAQEMLRKWEAGDQEVRELWERMNGWVYEGFDVSYKKLGVDFDKMYYESNTYLLGKEIVERGLKKGVLFKKENGSIWIDLTADGLDEKLLLRGDGTSVYITQDLGTAVLKYNDFKLDKSIYVIADEQNYHMQVLKLILQKLGEPCADGIYHLSYGMVELPSGRMKSREGTVVDADDMMAEMIGLAQEQTEQAGKTEGFTQEELTTLYETIGMGALKFYLLRVDPKKKMIFDPKESIDLHGFTATFIQYAHARICSILRKEGVDMNSYNAGGLTLSEDIAQGEKNLILALEQYPSILEAAAEEYNPSLLCNYAFHVAQLFNSFFELHSISKAESEEKKRLRLMTIIITARTLRHAMNLLGIRLPERM